MKHRFIISTNKEWQPIEVRENVVSPTAVSTTVISPSTFHLLRRFAYCHFVYDERAGARRTTMD